ncbi:mitochondrial carrier domain-containing protein [Gaertneriomyces semiglobifer]|nr:mitochondrial carrier domain-containing protein [Gaertneriomyces semiglobifer]
MDPHLSAIGIPPIYDPAGQQSKQIAEHVHSPLPERINLSDMDTGKYAAFGSLFILCVDTSLFPLDTVKTVIMSDKGAQFGRTSVIKTIYRMAKNEGIARFWRGLPPAVVGSFPGQAMYYLAYETVQDVWAQNVAAQSFGSNPFLRGFAAGAWAEISAGLFYVPADVVAQRLQVQNVRGFAHNSRLYTGPIDLARRIFRIEGLRGFYRGYVAYIGAYAPASAVQWGSYEHSKSLVHKALSVMERYTARPVQNREHVINALSGGVAGFSSVCANNPFEILRIRQQLLDPKCTTDAEIMKRGYWHLARTIYQQEGIGGFYKGLRLRLLVTVPGAMFAMSGYETIKSWSSQ